MSNFRMAIFAAGLALFGLGANAQAATPGVYGGVGYTHYDGDDVSLGGITGRLGYEINPNFAVEGEASLGVVDDEIGPVEIELNSAFGLYVMGKLPVTDRLEAFARAGYHWTEVEASALGTTAAGDEDGFAFGAGGQYWLTDRFGVRGEYTRLDGDDGELDTFGIGGVVKF